MGILQMASKTPCKIQKVSKSHYKFHLRRIVVVSEFHFRSVPPCLTHLGSMISHRLWPPCTECTSGQGNESQHSWPPLMPGGCLLNGWVLSKTFGNDIFEIINTCFLSMSIKTVIVLICFNLKLRISTTPCVPNEQPGSYSPALIIWPKQIKMYTFGAKIAGEQSAVWYKPACAWSVYGSSYTTYSIYIYKL